MQLFINLFFSEEPGSPTELSAQQEHHRSGRQQQVGGGRDRGQHQYFMKIFHERKEERGAFLRLSSVTTSNL